MLAFFVVNLMKLLWEHTELQLFLYEQLLIWKSFLITEIFLISSGFVSLTWNLCDSVSILRVSLLASFKDLFLWRHEDRVSTRSHQNRWCKTNFACRSENNQWSCLWSKYHEEKWRHFSVCPWLFHHIFALKWSIIYVLSVVERPRQLC